MILDDPQRHAKDQPAVAVVERSHPGRRLLAQQSHERAIAQPHGGRLLAIRDAKRALLGAQRSSLVT